MCQLGVFASHLRERKKTQQQQPQTSKERERESWIEQKGIRNSQNSIEHERKTKASICCDDSIVMHLSIKMLKVEKRRVEKKKSMAILSEGATLYRRVDNEFNSL